MDQKPLSIDDRPSSYSKDHNDSKYTTSSMTPTRLVHTAPRKSVVFLNNDIFKDVPKAFASYDGKFISCNDMFSDITGISGDNISKHDVLSIVKFDSFEGPQTAAYAFNELSSQFTAAIASRMEPSDVSSSKKSSYGLDLPDFTWTAPLGTIRKGVLEKRLEVYVRTENYQIDDNYVLSVYVRAPKSRLPNVDRAPSNTFSKSMKSMSYGSLKEAEVLESSTLKKFSVLVVDSSQTTLKSIEKQISETGHNVDTEQDRETALNSLKATARDVALIEIHRLAGGEISGLEVAHEWRIFERLYRSSTPPMIIIAMSAEYDDSMFLEAMNAGFDGFIVKPFTSADLLSIILMIDEERLTRK